MAVDDRLTFWAGRGRETHLQESICCQTWVCSIRAVCPNGPGGRSVPELACCLFVC